MKQQDFVGQTVEMLCKQYEGIDTAVLSYLTTCEPVGKNVDQILTQTARIGDNDTVILFEDKSSNLSSFTMSICGRDMTSLNLTGYKNDQKFNTQYICTVSSDFAPIDEGKIVNTTRRTIAYTLED